MGILPWISQNWFEFLQTVGIVGGLFFSGYGVRKEDQARRIENLIALKQQHSEIWREPSERKELFRVKKIDVDLDKDPISEEETLFVTRVILHVDTVHRAMKAGMFVKIDGLEKDIKGFFLLPIPKAVWEKLKPLQDRNFVKFVENALR